MFWETWNMRSLFRNNARIFSYRTGRREVNVEVDQMRKQKSTPVKPLSQAQRIIWCSYRWFGNWKYRRLCHQRRRNSSRNRRNLPVIANVLFHSSYRKIVVLHNRHCCCNRTTTKTSVKHMNCSFSILVVHINIWSKTWLDNCVLFCLVILQFLLY